MRPGLEFKQPGESLWRVFLKSDTAAFPYFHKRNLNKKLPVLRFFLLVIFIWYLTSVCFCCKGKVAVTELKHRCKLVTRERELCVYGFFCYYQSLYTSILLKHNFSASRKHEPLHNWFVFVSKESVLAGFPSKLSV